jgi:hypothetical protein
LDVAVIEFLEALAAAKTSTLTTALSWVVCAMGWMGTAAMGLALADRIKELERKGKDDAGSGDGS